MVTLVHPHSKDPETPEDAEDMERKRTMSQTPPHYGSISGDLTDTCPTCRGIGRIPRRQQNQLVAVIPCDDARLKPKSTKLYVCISMAVCLLISCLILFFLFPRSVVITPVAIKSVLIYFTPTLVNITITNVVNISNDNYCPIEIGGLDVQVVAWKTVLSGKIKMPNMTGIPPRSQKSYTLPIDLSIEDRGLNKYCKMTSINVHTLLLELQMTMNITYLSHGEQVSLTTYEYINCAINSTVPHLTHKKNLK